MKSGNVWWKRPTSHPTRTPPPRLERDGGEQTYQESKRTSPVFRPRQTSCDYLEVRTLGYSRGRHRQCSTGNVIIITPFIHLCIRKTGQVCVVETLVRRDDHYVVRHRHQSHLAPA